MVSALKLLDNPAARNGMIGPSYSILAKSAPTPEAWPLTVEEVWRLRSGTRHDEAGSLLIRRASARAPPFSHCYH